jgi:hypothetical protein
MISIDSATRAEIANEVDESQAVSQPAPNPATHGGGIENWSLYNYAYNFLESSFLIYSFADLRRYARKGLFDGDSCDAILSVPIRVESAVELLWKHRDIAEKVGRIRHAAVR